MSPTELSGIFTVYDSSGNVDTWERMTRSFYQSQSDEATFYNAIRNHDWKSNPELRIRVRSYGGGSGVYYTEWRLVRKLVPPFVY